MKVALLYTGFFRSFHNLFENHDLFIFKKYNPDIYISTWDLQENDEIIDASFFNFFGGMVKKIKINSSSEYHKNRPYIFKQNKRNNDVFVVDNRAYNANLPYGGPEFWIHRLLDQWFIVNEGMKLIDEDYDIVVRLRFDLYFKSFSLDHIKNLTIPLSPAELIGQQEFNDHLAYGEKNLMIKYSELFNCMIEIYENHNFDISYAEKVLKFYLNNYVTEQINRVNSINYSIIK